MTVEVGIVHGKRRVRVSQLEGRLHGSPDNGPRRDHGNDFAVAGGGRKRQQEHPDLHGQETAAQEQPEYPIGDVSILPQAEQANGGKGTGGASNGDAQHDGVECAEEGCRAAGARGAQFGASARESRQKEGEVRRARQEDDQIPYAYVGLDGDPEETLAAVSVSLWWQGRESLVMMKKRFFVEVAKIFKVVLFSLTAWGGIVEDRLRHRVQELLPHLFCHVSHDGETPL